MHWLLRVIYLGTVFVTGAGVLIVEVTAVRFLAPYFGASLYVLSSVLTVILLALALGYYAGGRLSDRLPSHQPLYTLITGAGLTLLALTYAALHTLPDLGAIFPLAIGPLVVALLFFFVPAFLLGIDSPYVIRLLTDIEPPERRGGIVGATFFWSTAGSITGSLLAGFVLVPLLGLTESLTLTGGALVLLGLLSGGALSRLHHQLGYTLKQPQVSLLGPVFVALALASGLIYANLTHGTPHSDILYEDDGYYSSILVYNDTYAGRPARFLRRDTNHSSAIFLEHDDPVFVYSQFALLYPQLFPDEPPASFLMLGGGAYTIPRMLHEALPELMVDVVELEPSLYPLAQQYFELPRSERIENHVADARPYLNRTDERYDLIFVDTFSTGHFVPPHLVTVEFFRELREHLTEDGIVMVNFIGTRSGEGRTVTGSFTKTFTSVFPNTEIYAQRPDHPEHTQNLVFIARNGSTSLDLDPETIIQEHRLNRPLEDLAIVPDTLVTGEDTLFTDNHSPVELLLVEERVWQ